MSEVKLERIKLKGLPKTIYEEPRSKDTDIRERLGYVAGWDDATERQFAADQKILDAELAKKDEEIAIKDKLIEDQADAIRKATVILTEAKEEITELSAVACVGIQDCPALKKEKQEWEITPDKAGEWWMSPYFADKGIYATPCIKRVIDYQDGKELEVEDGNFNFVKVSLIVSEYYPKARWLYIPLPDIFKSKYSEEK
jgi:hypothetical protein